MSTLVSVATSLSYNDALEVAFESAVEHAFKAAQKQHGELRSISDAMELLPDEHDKWLKAAQDKIQPLVKNGTLGLCSSLLVTKPLARAGCFMSSAIQMAPLRNEYKGRLVTKGFSQCPGFDYNETFSPTPKWASIRAILALAALKGLKLESVDISSAYPNGKLKEEVYMQQLEGFEGKTPQWVWCLCKAFYGLKQASCCWHEKLHEVLLKLGFACLVCKHSVWVYLCNGVHLIIPVFVDNITIAGKSKAAIQHVKDDLRMHFKLRDLGPTSWLLGVKSKIKCDCSMCSLSILQGQYTLDILDHYGFEDCDLVDTPMDPGLCLSTEMAFIVTH